MEHKTISKFGKVCQMIYSNDKLTEPEKKELIDKIGETILDALKESHKTTLNKILNTYNL